MALVLVSGAGCGSATGPRGGPQGTAASADCPTLLRYDGQVYAGSSTVVEPEVAASWPDLTGTADLSACDDAGADARGAYFPDHPDDAGDLTVVELPEAPDALHVTCDRDGIQVDSEVVAAGPEGVVLVVDSTLPAGSYLTYGSPEGPSGGDAITPRPVTYAVPPGPLTLGCAAVPGMDETGEVTVSVTDPHVYWRTTTVADVGCPAGGAQPSWAAELAGAGDSAEAAVEDLLTSAAGTLGGEQRTARVAEVGYVGPDSQTWVVLVDGTARLTLAVTREGERLRALPDQLCGPG